MFHTEKNEYAALELFRCPRHVLLSRDWLVANVYSTHIACPFQTSLISTHVKAAAQHQWNGLPLTLNGMTNTWRSVCLSKWLTCTLWEIVGLFEFPLSVQVFSSLLAVKCQFQGPLRQISPIPSKCLHIWYRSNVVSPLVLVTVSNREYI